MVYEDTATGKYYYNGQEMNYEKLADDYNWEHKVGHMHRVKLLKIF